MASNNQDTPQLLRIRNARQNIWILSSDFPKITSEVHICTHNEVHMK